MLSAAHPRPRRPTWLVAALLLAGQVVAQEPPLLDDVTPPSSPRFIRGDANGDWRPGHLTDPIAILDELFRGARHLGCYEAADADDNGVLNITDPIYLLLLIYSNGKPPPSPFPGCGEDPTEDRLGCLEYDGCEPLPPAINSMGMRFVWIEPGCFEMGSPEDERSRDPDEQQHRVCFTCGFYMQATEVTREQYLRVLGRPPTRDCPECAVHSVTWYDAVEFCRRLNELEGRPEEGGYRLPTEAEHEYGTRAGTTTRFWFGDALECVDTGGWSCPAFDDHMWWLSNTNSPRPTNPVGVKPANPWGLHDMHGNGLEWCLDWYAPYPEVPEGGALIDPVGPRRGTQKVFRGNAMYLPKDGRSAARSRYEPNAAGTTSCFRVVLGGCPHVSQR